MTHPQEARHAPFVSSPPRDTAPVTYLLDRHVAHGPKWYDTRRLPILAIVEHITAGLEGVAATDDQSAERTAAYAATTDRKVSWHQGTDTDSNLVLLPDDHTAFHCAGYNSCTLGRELSKRHTDWRTMPRHWVQATLGNAAPNDAEWCRKHNIPVRKASRRELDDAIAHYRATGQARPVGFIGHGELDPARRIDPGFVRSVDTFPWHSYLELVARHLTPPTEDDTMVDDIIGLHSAYFGVLPGTKAWTTDVIASMNWHLAHYLAGRSLDDIRGDFAATAGLG